MGADVIKVEAPTGDMTRFGGPWTRDDEEKVYSGGYAIRNRNKRSICLDLTKPEDLETFLQLVETADGMIENMRAGVLDRLGAGWDACHARNPQPGLRRDPRLRRPPHRRQPLRRVARVRPDRPGDGRRRRRNRRRREPT